MSRRRPRRHVPPDLTSLFDVLFIVIFAALIRAAAAQQALAAAQPVPPPPPPPKPLPPAQPLASAALQTKALAQLAGQLEARPVVIARIAQDGTLTGVELGDRRVALDVPLLEQNRDPDIALAYLGDRSADLRVCRQASLHLGLPDLAGHLVVIAPDARGADLPHALYEGLRRDVDRCQTDQRGLAVVVEPEGATP